MKRLYILAIFFSLLIGTSAQPREPHFGEFYTFDAGGSDGARSYIIHGYNKPGAHNFTVCCVDIDVDTAYVHLTFGQTPVILSRPPVVDTCNWPANEPHG